jgi:hypothetical protein
MAKIRYIRLQDVPRVLLELTGQTRCRATIYNWVCKGKRGYDNVVIKLKIKKTLGMMFTTREWVVDFIQKLGQ